MIYASFFTDFTNIVVLNTMTTDNIDSGSRILCGGYILADGRQFDEVPVRLVLLAPLQGVTYVLKNDGGTCQRGCNGDVRNGREMVASSEATIHD